MLLLPNGMSKVSRDQAGSLAPFPSDSSSHRLEDFVDVGRFVCGTGLWVCNPLCRAPFLATSLLTSPLESLSMPPKNRPAPPSTPSATRVSWVDLSTSARYAHSEVLPVACQFIHMSSQDRETEPRFSSGQPTRGGFDGGYGGRGGLGYGGGRGGYGGGPAMMGGVGGRQIFVGNVCARLE